MDLISAIKSGKQGKRFKEVGGHQWLVIGVNSGAIIPYGGGEAVRFTTAQLLAEYEVEEEKIELTAEQIRKAMLKYPAYIYPGTVVYVLKELGFKE